MSSLVKVEPSVEAALKQVALDLRQFVNTLKSPSADRHAWFERVRTRCAELSEQVGVIRERFAKQRPDIKQPLLDLRSRLQDLAAQRFEDYSSGRLGDLRHSLAQTYEDFVEQVRARKLFTASTEKNLRAVRIPKLTRSLFHVSMGLLCVFLNEFVLTQQTSLIILLSLAVVFVSLETLRRYSVTARDFMVDKLFGLISRPDERYRVNSGTYYLVAMAVITAFASVPAVSIGVLVLALGDPAASFFGHRWGRIRLYNDKSLTGSLAFFMTAAVVLSAYLFFLVPSATLWWGVGLVVSVGLVGTLTELFSGKLDDNFSIPVACALVAMLWF